MDMFVALVEKFCKSSEPITCFLGKEYAVYDWTRLGVFAGFRIIEYAQNSKVKKRHKFLLVPANSCVPPEFHHTPMAFTLDDLRFYDTNHIWVPHQLVHTRHLKREILELEIRWRYDKSAHNLQVENILKV